MLHVLLPLVAAHPLCGDHWHCAPQQIVDRLHIAADRNESGSNGFSFTITVHHSWSLLGVAQDALRADTSVQARRNDFGSGAAMEGGSGGPPPGKKFQKLKPIASISGHLVPFQCTVTTMKDFLILQKTKKMLRSGTNITLPGKKIQKLKPIASIPRHLVPFQCTWTFDSATNHDRGQGFATFALIIALCCSVLKKKTPLQWHNYASGGSARSRVKISGLRLNTFMGDGDTACMYTHMYRRYNHFQDDSVVKMQLENILWNAWVKVLAKQMCAFIHYTPVSES